MKINPQLKQELKDFVLKKEKEKGRKVTVISPYKLGEEEMAILKSHYPQLREALIENEVDPSLIAGVVIKFGTKMIDISLKGELQSLNRLIYGIT